MDIPRTLVLGANPGRWRYSDDNASFRDGNGVEAWAYALRGDYSGPPFPKPQSDLSEYELVIANLHPKVIERYPKLQDGLPASTKWVSLVEGAGEEYSNPRQTLLEVLARSNLVATINEATNPLFQRLTKNRVAFVGIPYPVAAMRSRRVPVELRRNEVLICPRQDRGPSIRVAIDSGLTLRAYAPRVSRKLSNLLRFVRAGHFARDLEVKALASSLPEGSIVEFERDLEPFHDEAAGCKLWVNLDARLTWARYVLDAAALGVPIITTANTGHGPKLFPATTVLNCVQQQEAAKIARRLIEDDEFYEETIEYASAGLNRFDFEPTAQRLLGLLR